MPCDDKEKMTGSRLDISLGQVLEPGVASGTHKVLRLVLFLLLLVLLVCMLLGINQPHSTIWFLLACGLTLSYYWFMEKVALQHHPEK
ncbi:hypothetical protein GAYE_SCF24G4383 [Galdieria yellowstonensis]|uniref:Uncharacterized protein n=1 Tax=Galdieria yellowstonensis TaxID=3028027 RepID=A0AAV9IG87_9RHOD|nr:hypothetical protein GAYE_SCF24G4383 [Galdieria yellowstonensis]